MLNVAYVNDDDDEDLVVHEVAVDYVVYTDDDVYHREFLRTGGATIVGWYCIGGMYVVNYAVRICSCLVAPQ